MRFAFDLWSHDDVSRNADAILARLRAGTMPCDGVAFREDRCLRTLDDGRHAALTYEEFDHTPRRAGAALRQRGGITVSHKNLNPSVPGRPKRRHRAVEPGRVVDHRLAGRVLVVGADAPLLQVHRGRLRGRAVQPPGRPV